MSNITLSQIEKNPELSKNQENLKVILNHKPAKAWVKEHPFARGVKYIPIGQVENLLDTIFLDWRIEIISTSQLFNSVAVQVRLHYLNPVNGEWSYHDGVGAVGIQTDKGKAASDLTAVKQDSVMKALPAAKSYAIKDAAEHLGAIFGRDLNRKEEYAFNRTRLNKEEQLDEIKLLYMEKEDKIPENEKAILDRIINNQEEASYSKAIRELNKL
tara:strand:- start:2270 stop:2911 length:642 start_codon:yes stop_codon:yes gene_type:complete